VAKPFLAKITVRDPAKLGIKQRDEPIQCAFLAICQVLQEQRNRRLIRHLPVPRLYHRRIPGASLFMIGHRLGKSARSRKISAPFTHYLLEPGMAETSVKGNPMPVEREGCPIDNEIDQRSLIQSYLEQIAANNDAGKKKTHGKAAPITETVLIVDDDDAVRNLVTMGLRLQGYRTLTAANGLQALDVAERHSGRIDARRWKRTREETDRGSSRAKGALHVGLRSRRANGTHRFGSSLSSKTFQSGSALAKTTGNTRSPIRRPSLRSLRVGDRCF
jgi:hypothetical protein